MRVITHITATALAIALLAGCASQILESYVGKSIYEPMLDYGQPASVIDLPNGQRAFQWKITQSGAIPIYTPTTSQIYGPGGWATVTTTTTSYSPYSSTCLYTLIGERREGDWVVVGFRKPTLMCE
jgi:hypothetical protein